MEPLLQRNPGHTATTMPRRRLWAMRYLAESLGLWSASVAFVRCEADTGKEEWEACWSLCERRVLKLSGKCAKAEYVREARL